VNNYSLMITCTFVYLYTGRWWYTNAENRANAFQDDTNESMLCFWSFTLSIILSKDNLFSIMFTPTRDPEGFFYYRVMLW